MIKKTKKSNFQIGDVYAIPLIDGSWTLGQICFLLEVEGYYSISMAFFNYKFISIESLNEQIDTLDLSCPFTAFTITGETIKKKIWILIAHKMVHYVNFCVEYKKKNSWGWIDGIEREMNWILEMYFGIYPWDAFADKKYMDKLLLPMHEKPSFARERKDFTLKELEQKKIL